MFEFRVVIAASAVVIRGWLTSLVDRLIPIDPDPEGWGQPQMASRGFTTDPTLRPFPVPPEVEAAGGFGVGLEMALWLGDGHVQPMGPVVVFVVVPLSADRCEVRVFFPLGLAPESRGQVKAEFIKDWPGLAISPDHFPRWMMRDFDRRALFEAIATGGPLPPGAPVRRHQTDPLPWRDEPGEVSRDPHDAQSDWEGPKGQDAEIVRLWRLGITASGIAQQIGRERKTVENRIGALRRQYTQNVVPYRRSRT